MESRGEELGTDEWGQVPILVGLWRDFESTQRVAWKEDAREASVL